MLKAAAGETSTSVNEWYVLNAVVNDGKLPEDWRRSWMVDVHKGTGDALTCGSYRAKNLLEHVMTSHNLYPPPVTNCHTFSDPLPPLERDILYGRPQICSPWNKLARLRNLSRGSPGRAVVGFGQHFFRRSLPGNRGSPAALSINWLSAYKSLNMID